MKYIKQKIYGNKNLLLHFPSLINQTDICYVCSLAVDDREKAMMKVYFSTRQH